MMKSVDMQLWLSSCRHGEDYDIKVARNCAVEQRVSSSLTRGIISNL